MHFEVGQIQKGLVWRKCPWLGANASSLQVFRQTPGMLLREPVDVEPPSQDASDPLGFVYHLSCLLLITVDC